MSVVVVMLVLMMLILALAWYDGGREEPRLIEQDVDLSRVGKAVPQ